MSLEQRELRRLHHFYTSWRSLLCDIPFWGGHNLLSGWWTCRSPHLQPNATWGRFHLYSRQCGQQCIFVPVQVSSRSTGMMTELTEATSACDPKRKIKIIVKKKKKALIIFLNICGLIYLPDFPSLWQEVGTGRKLPKNWWPRKT